MRLPTPPVLLALLTVLALALVLGIRLADRAPQDAPTLLLTGFGPFPGFPVNPSWEVARALDGTTLDGHVVRAVRLDVAYGRAADQLRAAVRRSRPAIVVNLGVAAGDAIRLETTARNADRAEAPDVDGVVGGGRPVRATGPATLPSRLPLAALERDLEAAGFAVRRSDDAGGYLCNHVFYVALDEVAAERPVGFIPVPPTEGAWTPARLEDAVRAALATIVRETR